MNISSKDAIEKYIRDSKVFEKWLSNREISKGDLLTYKKSLTEKYTPASVNSVIASLNGFFAYMERFDLKILKFKNKSLLAGKKS